MVMRDHSQCSNSITMNVHLFAVILVLTFQAVFAQRGTKCVTPNKEDGTCIDEPSCRPIAEAIKTKGPGAIEFAKESACGHDTAPLVCCGTKGSYDLPDIFALVVTTPPTDPLSSFPTKPPVTTSSTTETAKHDPIIFKNELPDRTVCGIDYGTIKIKGGGDTQPAEFPWMAALEYNNKMTGQNAGIRCGGTVINNRHVLTAAHCIINQEFEMVAVRLGEWKLSTDPDCVAYGEYKECSDKVVILEIKAAIPHPFYSLRTGDNDIGLLELEGDITFTDYIRPICLPQSELPPPTAGTKLTVIGWGTTENGTTADVKQKVEVPLITNTNCHQKSTTKRKANANQLCAGGEEGKDSCNGDSGGPLMRMYEDKVTQQVQWYQEGVVSYGVGCGRAGAPAIYTRVNIYINWIINNIKESSTRT